MCKTIEMQMDFLYEILTINEACDSIKILTLRIKHRYIMCFAFEEEKKWHLLKFYW